MSAPNIYSRNLGPIGRLFKLHRNIVGGQWETIGRLQFDFLVAQGLTPASTLLDVGCGALRGGVHFVDYLDDGNYYGIDLNSGLLKAGQQEVRAAGLRKRPNLHRTDEFDASVFGVRFDFGVSVSLFTHLDANHISYCLMQMRRVMHESSRFYFTFFEVAELPIPDLADQGTLTTHFLSDPFHYTWAQMEFFAKTAGLLARNIGDWNHPRNQRMMELRVSPT